MLLWFSGLFRFDSLADDYKRVDTKAKQLEVSEKPRENKRAWLVKVQKVIFESTGISSEIVDLVSRINGRRHVGSTREEVEDWSDRIRRLIARQQEVVRRIERIVKQKDKGSPAFVGVREMRAQSARLGSLTVSMHIGTRMGTESLDAARRGAIWEVVLPISHLLAGVAGVLTASEGMSFMVVVVACVLVTTSVVGRVLCPS